MPTTLLPEGTREAVEFLRGLIRRYAGDADDARAAQPFVAILRIVGESIRTRWRGLSAALHAGLTAEAARAQGADLSVSAYAWLENIEPPDPPYRPR